MARQAYIAWSMVVGLAIATAAWADDSRSLMQTVRAAQDQATGDLLKKLVQAPLTESVTVETFLKAEPSRADRLRAWLMAGDLPQRVEDGDQVTVQVTVAWSHFAGFLQSLAEQTGEAGDVPASAFTELARRQDPAPTARVKAGLPAGLILPPRLGTTSVGGLKGEVPANWKAGCSQQGVLQAMRQARLDGYDRLARRISEIHISPEQTVSDYIAVSDEPDVDMMVFLKGAITTGYRFHDDMLLVQADVEVSLRGAMVSFKAWADQHVPPEKASIRKLMTYVNRVQARVIRQVGYGTPPVEFLTNPDADGGRLRLIGTPPAWTAEPLQVTALAPEGLDGPAGERMAEALAMYDLLQAVRALPITETLTVGQYADRVTDLQPVLRVLAASAEYRPSPAAENRPGMTLILDVQALWPALARELKDHPITIPNP